MSYTHNPKKNCQKNQHLYSKYRYKGFEPDLDLDTIQVNHFDWDKHTQRNLCPICNTVKTGQFYDETYIWCSSKKHQDPSESKQYISIVIYYYWLWDSKHYKKQEQDNYKTWQYHISKHGETNHQQILNVRKTKNKEDKLAYNIIRKNYSKFILFNKDYHSQKIINQNQINYWHKQQILNTYLTIQKISVVNVLRILRHAIAVRLRSLMHNFTKVNESQLVSINKDNYLISAKEKILNQEDKNSNFVFLIQRSERM